MHIGFITSHFPFPDAPSVGGIGTGIKNLSDELINLGHQVSVFVYGQSADEWMEIGGVSIFKIRNIKLKGLSWMLTRKKIESVINETHKKTKIDIVESPDWQGITSFIKLKCPIVIRLNGSDTYFCHLEDRPVKFLNRMNERKALQNADAIIAVSKFTGDLTNAISELQRDFSVVPNGIDISRFSPSTGHPDPMNILYFGGIIRKKGLLEIPHYFNRVVERFPEATLTLAGMDMPDIKTGNPSTKSMMEKLFSERAFERVTFLGSVPYQQIDKYIRNATVCIFPSYAEAMPLSWLEAMALGKAIVASDIGWSNEIIEDGVDGFKVSPKDHDLFADRIMSLLADENLRKNIELNARKKMELKFATKVTALQSLAVYGEVIKKNARA